MSLDVATSARLLGARTGEMVSLLRRLVSIECDTRHKPGVDEAADVVQAELESLGFAAQRIAQATVGDQRLATKPGRVDRLLFLTHVDSVFPVGTCSRVPFRLDAERAHGPGVLDMKGGIVCMFEAFRALRGACPSLYDDLDLAVIVNTDEETGSTISRPLLEAEAAKAGAVCVLEAARPGGEYVTARKAVARLHVTFRGKAAHAGLQPEKGIDAIRSLVETLKEVYRLADREHGLTINVGVVKGGTKAGVVPDLAEAEIDIRAWDDTQVQQTTDRILEVVRRFPVPGTEARVDTELSMPAWPATPAGECLFGMVREIAREVGFAAASTATGAFSDANYTARIAPTIDALGPTGGNPHALDEYLWLSSLVPRSQVILHFIDRWPVNAGRLKSETHTGRGR